VPDTLEKVKPNGIYRVTVNGFAYNFKHGGKRFVQLHDEIRLTSEEATALMAGPVLVMGPKPGSELPDTEEDLEE
jgi:hypothetical protein